MSTMHRPADWDQAGSGPGPLAWVLDELRKSLDGAVKAMRRFVRDAEPHVSRTLRRWTPARCASRGSNCTRPAVRSKWSGMGPPALVLRAMEAAVQKFVQRPEPCSDDAASTIERASFALIEYLESVLAGKPVSPLPCFPNTVTPRLWPAPTASTRPTCGRWNVAFASPRRCRLPSRCPTARGARGSWTRPCCGSSRRATKGRACHARNLPGLCSPPSRTGNRAHSGRSAPPFLRRWPGPASSGRLCQARGLACADAVRHAGQGRHTIV